MSSLDNRIWIEGGDGDDWKVKLQNFWNKYKVWIIVGLVCLVIGIVIVIVVVSTNKKKKDNFTPISESYSPRENFISKDDIGENGFVNSYIKSCVPNFV